MPKTRRNDTRSTNESSEREPTRLQLDDDPTFHRRERIMRRIGTVVLCAVLIAALLGVFGSGPLSNGEARSSDNALVVRYERFTRARAAAVLRLAVRAPPGGSSLVLTLNAAFAERIQIEQILPEPLGVTTAAERYVFEFGTARSDTLASIVLRYRPESLGVVPIVIETHGSEVRFRQLVYP
jgi:hypothetical protein